MQFKTIIVDDEIHCVEVLEILLQQNFPEIEIVEKFNSPIHALNFLQSNTVDLVFLDIQMPFMTGIDMLQKLPNRNFHVIFTTAFDQYALKAIKLSALDYLLKPIDEEQLETAISKFKKDKKQNNLQDQLTQFLAQTNSDKSESKSDKIAISFQDKIVFYNPDDIVYCQSQDNYTNIFLKDKTKITSAKTIKHFEEILSPKGFIRTHQSYLINPQFIEQYNRRDGGFIVLKDNIEIPVSRNKKDIVFSYFTNI